MKRDYYSKTLENLQEEYQVKVQRLAAEYREFVLLPLCKKHKLCFVSGMGTFFFHSAADGDAFDGQSWSVRDMGDAIQERKRYLIPYLEMLDQEVEQGQYFGYYIDDITHEDLG